MSRTVLVLDDDELRAIRRSLTAWELAYKRTPNPAPRWLTDLIGRVDLVDKQSTADIDSGEGEWVTRAEAATLLGCSPRTIDRRVTAGTLRSRRIGHAVLVDPNGTR